MNSQLRTFSPSLLCVMATCAMLAGLLSDLPISFANTRTSATAGLRESEPDTPEQRHDQDSSMKTGVLAITSDEAGTLFIDGAEATKMEPGRVVTLKLVAGQHFVELRDEQGNKLWEKLVTVPEGAQAAERIELLAKKPLEEPTLPNGEWVCENWCDTATISVSGSVFYARVETVPPKNAICESPSGRCVWLFQGTIDGLTIEGVKSEVTPAALDAVYRCNVREDNHPFKASIFDDGTRISINTEGETVAASGHNASTWKWQKPKIVCDGTHIDHLSPLMFVMHSTNWSGQSTSAP